MCEKSSKVQNRQDYSRCCNRDMCWKLDEKYHGGDNQYSCTGTEEATQESPDKINEKSSGEIWCVSNFLPELSARSSLGLALLSFDRLNSSDVLTSIMRFLSLNSSIITASAIVRIPRPSLNSNSEILVSSRVPITTPGIQGIESMIPLLVSTSPFML